MPKKKFKDLSIEEMEEKLGTFEGEKVEELRGRVKELKTEIKKAKEEKEEFDSDAFIKNYEEELSTKLEGLQMSRYLT